MPPCPGTEISNLGKQCVRVQAVFRGLRAQLKVSLLRDGIDSEAPKGLSETSFKSLTGAGNELRQLKKGAWALFRFIATLAFGGNRFYTSENNGYMDSKDETAADSARMPQNKKTAAFVADSTVYSDNLRRLCFHVLTEELAIGTEALLGISKTLEYIEYFEVESQVFSVLQFLISTVASRHVRDFLSKPDTILLLCKLVSFGSPRITLLTLRIMESLHFVYRQKCLIRQCVSFVEIEGIAIQENQDVSSTDAIGRKLAGKRPKRIKKGELGSFAMIEGL